MNEEYTYVKTNDIQKDMHDFVNHFGDEIRSISYLGNTIELNDGIIYRFTYTTIGIRNYYTYTEIYNHHLEFKFNKLQKENKKLKEQLDQKDNIINKAREKIRLLGKFDGNTCTRGLQMWSADFNKLLDMLKEVE